MRQRTTLHRLSDAAEAVADPQAQFRSILRGLAETKADRILVGPAYDHHEADDCCFPVLYGLPGGEFRRVSVSHIDDDTITLWRWALTGMVADVTENAIEVHVFDSLEQMTTHALEHWPQLMQLATARDNPGGHA
jgi:hypothetical protein